MRLNKRELALVLHAVRKTQEAILKGTDISQCLHFAGEGIKPLTSDEIEDLCGRLNTDYPTRLYRVTITRIEPSRRMLTVIVVRAKAPKQAKLVAVDVANEMWPKGDQKYSKMSGVPVELSVDELIEPENGGTGYCYPARFAPRVFRYTFK